MNNELPDGWKKYKLGEIIELLYGKGLREQDRKPGNIPVYGSNGIIGYHNTPLVKGPGIIIGRVGSIGKINYSPVDFYPIDTAYYVNLKKHNIDMKFLYYLLFTLPMNKLNFQSAVPGLNRNIAYSLDVAIPPLPEQRAIASIFPPIEDKIELLRQENETLYNMINTLFKQWFIKEAKEDWEEVPLINSDLAVLIKNGVHPFEGEKLYIETNNIDEFNINGGKFVTFKNKPSRAVMEPVPFSVWFAKKKGTQKTVMFDNNFGGIDKIILSNAFVGLKTTELSHYYIWCYVMSPQFQKTKDALASGSVQPDITKKELERLTILKPDEKTLIEFNSIVKDLFAKIFSNKQQIQTLSQLFDTLLHGLMSGKLRVDDVLCQS